MSAERQERVAKQTTALLAAMDLAEVRSTLGVTQEELANRLSISQSNVSRTERRHDMRVSTLHDVVDALGGKLHISVEFPGGTVELVQFTKDTD